MPTKQSIRMAMNGYARKAAPDQNINIGRQTDVLTRWSYLRPSGGVIDDAKQKLNSLSHFPQPNPWI
jgi:hypothetical protein